jgi:hypothetical protein
MGSDRTRGVHLFIEVKRTYPGLRRAAQLRCNAPRFRSSHRRLDDAARRHRGRAHRQGKGRALPAHAARRALLVVAAPDWSSPEQESRRPRGGGAAADSFSVLDTERRSGILQNLLQVRRHVGLAQRIDRGIATMTGGNRCRSHRMRQAISCEARRGADQRLLRSPAPGWSVHFREP